MKLRAKLLEFAKAVADVAERDPEFAARLGDLFGPELAPQKRPEPVIGRAKNRRPAAVMDPVAVVREGQDVLKSRLAELSFAAISTGSTFQRRRSEAASSGTIPGRALG